MFVFFPVLVKGLHGVDHLSSNTSFTSPLDETLDKEVLLMLQGPHPEHMAQEFRRLVNKMVKLLHLKVLTDKCLVPLDAFGRVKLWDDIF